MHVSIIIVNWNTCEILRNCLASIYASTRDLECEVIVIDNASSDSSVDMVKSEYPQVGIIANSENRGFAAANNQGMAIAKGRYVLLLNSDTVVLDNAVARTVSFADNKPDVAVVGCRVLNQDGTLQSTCFMFPSILNMLLSATYLYKLYPRSRFFGRERMTWWDRNDTREVDVVTGCYMLVRKKAIDQVGVMDERFFMYGEETDWCYRFKQAGWKVIFSPTGEIIHLGGQSSRQIGGEMLVQMRVSILYFMKKHYNWPIYRIACLWVIAFLTFRLPLWAGYALFSRKKRRESLLRVKSYILGISKTLYCLCTS